MVRKQGQEAPKERKGGEPNQTRTRRLKNTKKQNILPTGDLGLVWASDIVVESILDSKKLVLQRSSSKIQPATMSALKALLVPFLVPFRPCRVQRLLNSDIASLEPHAAFRE